MEPRTTPLHEALIRPHLVMGGERVPMQLLLAFCLGVPATSLNFPSFVICAVLWALGSWALRMAAKSDPQMLGIWWQSRSQQAVYPARSLHWRFQ